MSMPDKMPDRKMMKDMTDIKDMVKAMVGADHTHFLVDPQVPDVVGVYPCGGKLVYQAPIKLLRELVVRRNLGIANASDYEVINQIIDIYDNKVAPEMTRMEMMRQDELEDQLDQDDDHYREPEFLWKIEMSASHPDGSNSFESFVTDTTIEAFERITNLRNVMAGTTINISMLAMGD